MNMNVDVRIGKVTDVNKKKRLVRVKGSPPRGRGKAQEDIYRQLSERITPA